MFLGSISECGLWKHKIILLNSIRTKFSNFPFEETVFFTSELGLAHSLDRGKLTQYRQIPEEYCFLLESSWIPQIWSEAVFLKAEREAAETENNFVGNLRSFYYCLETASLVWHLITSANCGIFSPLLFSFLENWSGVIEWNYLGQVATRDNSNRLFHQIPLCVFSKPFITILLQGSFSWESAERQCDLSFPTESNRRGSPLALREEGVHFSLFPEAKMKFHARVNKIEQVD